MRCLKRGQSLDITFLELDESKTCNFLSIEEGVLRICLVSTINSALFPIGFFGAEWLKLEKDSLRNFDLRLEALNEVKFKITSFDEVEEIKDTQRGTRGFGSSG